MIMKKKIGIMGGTFDPIHMSHLIIAEAAYEQLKLDEILFLPSGNPPHKKERKGRGTDKQRVDMVSLAIAENPHFSLSLEDMVKDDYSYTYTLLERLKKENPSSELYFIIGADSLFDFHTWKNPKRICELCTLIVATRNQVADCTLNDKLQEAKDKYSGTFIKLHTPDLDISSNQIRQWVSENRSIRYYVPDAVRTYIEDHHMYKDCE